MNVDRTLVRYFEYFWLRFMINIFSEFIHIEAVARRCSLKNVVLKISQNSLENTCVAISFLIKVQARPATLLKKRLQNRCFPVNFVKYLRTLLLQNTSGGCFSSKKVLSVSSYVRPWSCQLRSQSFRN